VGGSSATVSHPGPDEIDIAPEVAHPARVYDYALGGHDNFAVDRDTVDHAAAVESRGIDHTKAAVQADHAFLARSVTYLTADVGIRQFLDIGPGTPTADTTHEIAQRLAPESRIVHANDDPLVLAHAHTLRRSTPGGSAAYIHADVRDPDAILERARATLDFDAPIGIVLVAILHHIDDHDDPHGIVARFVDAVPPGSYLVVSHLASDVDVEEIVEAARRVNEQPGFVLRLRTHAEITRFFDGVELLPPGVVTADRWHPPEAEPPPPDPWPIPFCVGVGRKP
jgi:S-adenosyl methyltransferase